MTARRAARSQPACTGFAAHTSAEAVRTPVADPRWRDLGWLETTFPDCVDDVVRSHLAMNCRADHVIRDNWALLNGFADPTDPLIVDWHRFGPFLREDHS